MGYNSQNDVESGEETRMENDSMATAKVHSGGSSKGNFGKPHKFYDKGPNKELKPVPADKQKSLGQLPTEARNNMGFEKYQPKKSGEAYDMKQAYNKDLTKGARFNYLKNAIHDNKKK